MCAVLGDLTGGIAECGHPQRRAVVNVLAGDPLPAVGDLLEGRRFVPPSWWPAPFAHHDAVDAIAERAHHHHSVGVGLADHPGFQIAAAHVGDEHLHGRRGAREVEAAQFAHRAATSVAADQVGRVDLPPARRVCHVDVDAVGTCVEVHHFGAVVNVGAEFDGPLLQHVLRLALRDVFTAEMATFDEAEVHRYATEMTQWTGLDGAEPRQQATLVEHFHRPSRKAQGPGLAGPLIHPLQHKGVDPTQFELRGKHQAGRPRAGNHHIPVCWHGNFLSFIGKPHSRHVVRTSGGMALRLISTGRTKRRDCCAAMP
jgi:hypothetical protein